MTGFIIRKSGNNQLKMKRYFFLTILLAVTMAGARAQGASCPGEPGGTGQSISVGRPLLKVAWDSTNDMIYMSDDMGAGRIWDFDGLSANSIDYNSYPYDVEVNPATGLLYFTLRTGGGVKYYNTVTHTLAGSISTGSNPYGLAISAPTKRLYVANSMSNTVSVISLDTASANYNKVIKTITVGTGPWQVGVNTVTGRVYVANRTSRTISVISEGALTVLGTIGLTFEPGEIGVNTSTNKVFVLSMTTNVVTVINGNTGAFGAVQTTFTAGVNPWGIAVNSTNNHIFITDHSSKTVEAIIHNNPPDGTSYTTFASYYLGSDVRGIELKLPSDEFIVASEDGYLMSGMPPCDRRNADKCIEYRNRGLVDDAAVDAFLTCYFHQ